MKRWTANERVLVRLAATWVQHKHCSYYAVCKALCPILNRSWESVRSKLKECIRHGSTKHA